MVFHYKLIWLYATIPWRHDIAAEYFCTWVFHRAKAVAFGRAYLKNVDVDVDVDDQEAPDSSKVYEQAVSERRKEGRDAEDDRLEEERGEDEGGREEEAGTHSAYLKKGSLLTFTWSKKLEIGN